MMTHSPLHTLTYWSTAMSVDSSTQFRQSCHTSFANISRPPVINPSMPRCPHRRAPPLSQCQKSLLSSRIRQPRQYTQNTFGLPLPMATSFPTLPKNVLMQIRSWCASVRTIPAIQRTGHLQDDGTSQWFQVYLSSMPRSRAALRLHWFQR